MIPTVNSLAITDPERIPAARYYSPEFFEAECEHLWPHVWQMACRLEEIPDPGDFVEYRNLDQSIIVVRVDADTIKAYFNACRHRGTKLVDDRGNCEGGGFICPFHGWCWNLDGSNSFVYQPELFSDAALDPDDLRLVECQVDTWAGCAFVNVDPDAPSLHASLGKLPQLLDPRERRRDALDVVAVDRAPRQLEARDGGVLRGLPRDADASAADDAPSQRAPTVRTRTSSSCRSRA